MLTKEQATAILQLLGRVTLNGNEAEAVVHLKGVLAKIAQEGEDKVVNTTSKPKKHE